MVWNPQGTTKNPEISTCYTFCPTFGIYAFAITVGWGTLRQIGRASEMPASEQGSVLDTLRMLKFVIIGFPCWAIYVNMKADPI